MQGAEIDSRAIFSFASPLQTMPYHLKRFMKRCASWPKTPHTTVLLDDVGIIDTDASLMLAALLMLCYVQQSKEST